MVYLPIYEWLMFVDGKLLQVNIPWTSHGSSMEWNLDRKSKNANYYGAQFETRICFCFLVPSCGYDSCCGSGGCCPRFWICTACMGLSVSRKHVQQMFMFFWHSTFYRAKSTIRPPFGEFFLFFQTIQQANSVPLPLLIIPKHQAENHFQHRAYPVGFFLPGSSLIMSFQTL